MFPTPMFLGEKKGVKHKESQGKDIRISHLEAIIHYPSSIHNFDNDLKTYLILLYWESDILKNSIICIFWQKITLAGETNV